MTIRRPKVLRLVLRLGGSVEILAFLAVVMPRAWMESTHEWLGLGTMPPLPVLDYMIRGASFTFGLHGVLLWILARNLDRFKSIIIFTGASYVVAGPVFFAVEHSAGIPLWWTVGDPLACFLFGVAILILEVATRPDGRHGGLRSDS